MVLTKNQNHQKIVTIGGGTGTFTLLRGLTRLTDPDQISAIPGMWDSGGSSGRLRSELGILPVGDVRQCFIGLMDDELQQEWAIIISSDRFKNKLGPLQGHDLFNLQFDILQGAAGGFQAAVDALMKLYKVSGHIYPVTLMNVDLGATVSEGPDLEGEGAIDERWKEPNFNPQNTIEDIYLTYQVDANPLALQAILKADKIIFPPGSLFGSILPHAQIRGIIEALHKSKAEIIFISNIMTERGQTDTLEKTSDYLEKFLKEFDLSDRINYLVINHNGVGEEPLEFYLEKGHQRPIQTDIDRCMKLAPQLKIASRPMAVYVNRLLRHDSNKLAEVVLEPDKFVLD